MAASNDIVAGLAKQPAHIKAAILVGVLAALGGIYWQFFYSSLAEEVENLENEHTTLQAENANLKTELDKYNDLVLEKEALDKKLEKNEVSLPASSELPAFFQHLEKQASAAGVTLKRRKREAETPIETYVRVPVEVEVRGTFYQINKYFHLLYQTDRIISVEDFTLGAPAGQGDTIQLTAKFTAVTYRAADLPPEKAPATPPPGAQPPAGGATPQPAGAGSPQGIQDRAKARVEAASDKKEAQADTAAGVQPAGKPPGGAAPAKAGGQ